MGTEATMNIMAITTIITTTIMVEDTTNTDKVAMACTTNINKNGFSENFTIGVIYSFLTLIFLIIKCFLSFLICNRY